MNDNHNQKCYNLYEAIWDIIILPVIAILEAAISCCSVMWAIQTVNKKVSFRFIITGGMLMTIVEVIKNMLAGTGVRGIWTGHEG